jgi:hypothetical protein
MVKLVSAQLFVFHKTCRYATIPEPAKVAIWYIRLTTICPFDFHSRGGLPLKRLILNRFQTFPYPRVPREKVIGHW